MKRSTLTLSILTALLVSACGGSSSNDEQTKDPTPSKVTPTHPTTPSTGKTPTTGNKDNAGTSGSSAGSSASSSSSSDPTPPISSGSAPSGGKPVVITSETKEKDKDKDKEPKDDPIKSIQDDLAAAKSELTKAKELEDEKKRRYEELMNPDMTTGVVNKRWTEQNSKRTALLQGLSLTEPSGEHFDIETFKKTIEKKKGTPGFDYNGKLAALKNYEDLRNEWLTAKAEALEVRGEWEKAQLETAKQKKKVAELEADILEKTAEIGSEKALAAKMKQQAKLIYKQEEAKVKAAEITAKLSQLITDGRELVKKQKDLTKAAELDPNDKELAGRLKNANEDVKKNAKDQEDLTKAQTKANAAANSAKNNVDSIDKEVKNLQEIAGNRGVMGNVNLSATNFLEIDQAEAIKNGNNIETWKLTLKDGAVVEIEVKDSSNNFNKKLDVGSGPDAVTYGHFGEIGGNNSKVKAAYNNISTEKTSIYGFIGDQFYSVGTVTPADDVKKLTDPAAGYSGRALLKAESGQDLIADVKAEVDFKDGDLTGHFHSFQTYKDKNGTLTPTALKTDETPENAELRTKLKDDKVKFAASIKGNKFATESETTGQANIYGYFYGDKAKELGGLVEYKNVFHGSFGGTKESN